MKKIICCILISLFCVSIAILKISNETLKTSKYINKNSRFKITGSTKPLAIRIETSTYSYNFNLFSETNMKNNAENIIKYLKNTYNRKDIKNKT